MRTLSILPLLTLVAAVSAHSQSAPAMNPAQAIAAAAAAGNGQVEGVFEMQVASTGAVGFNVYLNSQADFRDAANLSVELHPGALATLRKQLGGEPEDRMTGKRVRVKGIARRIAYTRPDGSPYYQTRIAVDLDSQIEIIG
jgi:hypothetical protein